MTRSTTATIGVFLVAFVWGVEFVLIHNAIAIMEPHSFNFLRFGVASIFIAACLPCRKERTRWNRRVIRHGFALGLLLYIGFTTQTFGLLYTSVSNSGFITGLNVVLVPLFAFLILRERPGILALMGIAIATGGLYLLTGGGNASFNVGDFLTLICAAMFALHIVLTGKIVPQHQALPLTLVQLLTVSLLSLGSAFLLENWSQLLNPSVIGSGPVAVAIFVAAILGTGLAFLVQTLAQGQLSSTRVAIIYASEPVFAALAAYLYLNEQLSAASGVGALMILTGIVFAELPLRPLAAEAEGEY